MQPPDAGPARQGAPGVFRVVRSIGRLHLITDEAIDPVEIVPTVGLAVQAGVDAVQVRYPHLGAREISYLVKAIQRDTVTSNTAVIVNDRVDVAMALGADGVHLGQRSLGVVEVRRLAGPDLLIGVSVHSMAEVTEAVAGGVEYLTFGHVYPTRSHPDEPGRGIALLAEVVAAVAPVPVIAIGGITPERVPDVLRAGATGVAVMRSILNTDNVAAATKSFIDAINHHVYS